MPRNDDIGDLPSLMPDSDEIKGTRKQSFSADKGGDARAEGADGSSRVGGRNGGRPIAAPLAMQSTSNQIVAKNSGILWFLVVIMFVGVLGGGYWSYNKLTDVDSFFIWYQLAIDSLQVHFPGLERLGCAVGTCLFVLHWPHNGFKTVAWPRARARYVHVRICMYKYMCMYMYHVCMQMYVYV